MKFIKSFKNYRESLKIEFGMINIDINESLGLLLDTVLKSISAQEQDMFDTFGLGREDFSDKMNLDLLTTNPDFIKTLSDKGLKKSNITNSDDYETFFKRPCRFMMIYDIDSSELENPIYIVIQNWNDAAQKWEDCKLYKVNGDIKNFYDKLSSKVIEIEVDGDKYIYQTTNGNEWILQNLDKSNKTFKKYFRTEDFENLIRSGGYTINII